MEITQKDKARALDLEIKFWPRLRRALRRICKYHAAGVTRMRLARMSACRLAGTEMGIFQIFPIQAEGCWVVRAVSGSCLDPGNMMDLLAASEIGAATSVMLKYTGIPAEELRCMYGSGLFLTPAAYLVAVPVGQRAA